MAPHQRQKQFCFQHFLCSLFCLLPSSKQFQSICLSVILPRITRGYTQAATLGGGRISFPSSGPFPAPQPGCGLLLLPPAALFPPPPQLEGEAGRRRAPDHLLGPHSVPKTQSKRRKAICRNSAPFLALERPFQTQRGASQGRVCGALRGAAGPAIPPGALSGI